jgi:NAD(P)-dependent dehydrogenase (short-subunit alcohol dehydrogenase family)
VIAPDHTAVPVERLLDLDGQVAVVTGGGRGIGRATARRLAQAGARVYAADLDHPDVPDGVEPVHLDVRCEKAVSALVDRVVADAGGVHAWVNAAGVFPRSGVLALPVHEWREVFRVNVEGTFLCARTAAAHMAAHGGGVIVNVASSVAHRVNDNAAHYRATKAAVLALTQNLAVELGRDGVRAIAVSPGLVMTEGVADLGRDLAALERYGARLPLGRAGVADDVARAVLFAVSPMAAYLTGCELLVDGGELQR